MGQKQGLLNLLKNLGLIFPEFVLQWKFILAVFLYKSHIRKSLLLMRYRPKSSQPIRLQDFLINHISRTNQWNSLIFCLLIQILIKWKLIKNILGGHGQKCVWPSWSHDSKIHCISRRNKWYELIFCMLVQMQESQKLF